MAAISSPAKNGSNEDECPLSPKTRALSIDEGSGANFAASATTSEGISNCDGSMNGSARVGSDSASAIKGEENVEEEDEEDAFIRQLEEDGNKSESQRDGPAVAPTLVKVGIAQGQIDEEEEAKGGGKKGKENQLDFLLNKASEYR